MNVSGNLYVLRICIVQEKFNYCSFVTDSSLFLTEGLKIDVFSHLVWIFYFWVHSTWYIFFVIVVMFFITKCEKKTFYLFWPYVLFWNLSLPHRKLWFLLCMNVYRTYVFVVKLNIFYCSHLSWLIAKKYIEICTLRKLSRFRSVTVRSIAFYYCFNYDFFDFSNEWNCIFFPLG